MKSSQINFYFLPEDIKELETYITERQFYIYNSKFCEDALLSGHEKEDDDGIKYLLHSFHKETIIKSFLKREKQFSTEAINSPLIEFLYPIFPYNGNKLLSGRLYYVKDIFDNTGKLIPKDESFLSEAENLFRWVKKHFKTEIFPGFEGYLVSKRSKNWVQAGKGELVLNNVL
ncbi:MAG: hypothetical protein H7A25_17830 [Leptospiraceae bacterium]|nr:hypothetical protein [Leptospiraceae bacterium]MCP5501768.1 hypothetical protein [Leptospiraceae bacterium]